MHTTRETGGIVSAIMVPHPPIILPNIGHGEEKKIADIDSAYAQAAKTIAASSPDTVVIVSPHAPSWLDYIQISSGKKARGDMSDFGDFKDSFDIALDDELAETITDEARQHNVPAGTLGRQNGRLDHGTMIPLYYLQQELPAGTRYLRVGIGGVDNLDHYAAGMMIAWAAQKLGRKVALVGSGDLSHCQNPDSHYGFKACGPAYDQKIMDIMGRAAFDELLEISDREADDAMVCGQKPFCVMAGAMDGQKPKAEYLGHSAVFGVGYGVCTYDQFVPDESRHFLKKAREKEWESYQKRTAAEDPYVQLARRTIEEAIAGMPLNSLHDQTHDQTHNQTHSPAQNQNIEFPEQMKKDQAGVFVSIHKNGALRGCIGTTGPTTANIAAEIEQNAISAATRDPRFAPVEAHELPALEISVDVLGKPEKVTSLEQLDPKKYGVIVSKGNRRGLLLPDLEGVDTLDQQLSIARQKAGLQADEPGCTVERFEVIRHH